MVRILGQSRAKILYRLVANGVAQAAAAILSSKIMHYAFDKVVRHNSSLTSTTIALVALSLAGAALLIAWLRMTERIDAEKMGQDYVKDLRVDLFEKISGSSIRSFQKKSKGGVMLRFVGDLRVIRQWISLGLARLIVASASALIVLLAIAWMSSIMAIVVTLVVITGCAVGLVRGGHLHQAVRDARKRQSTFAANVNEKISSIAVIQAFGQLHRERLRIEEQGEKLKDAMVVQASISAQLRAVGDATASFAAATVLITGAWEIQSGHCTPGTVVAAMSVIGLITPALRDLSGAFVLWHGARVSMEKVTQFLNSSHAISEQTDAPELRPGPGHLRFENIAFREVIKSVSGDVPAGKRVAIIGPNGSGKSTLLSIAARLVDPDRGKVLLDSQEIARHSLASLRRRIGMVSPDLPLLSGSIEKNVRYRWPDAPEEEVSRVLQICGVEEILLEFPKGLRSRITEGGSNLSLGQRQRISLARAILGNPSVLLLDEADANLDPKSSQVLTRVLESYPGTILFISHRKESVRAADLIWYLDDGELMAAGPPNDLFTTDGIATLFFQSKADQQEESEKVS